MRTVGREPLYDGASAYEGLGGGVKTRNFAALADYTYFPSGMAAASNSYSLVCS
jgi:hypothetical protein